MQEKQQAVNEREVDMQCIERLREHMKWMDMNFASSDTIGEAVSFIDRTIKNIEARYGKDS